MNLLNIKAKILTAFRYLTKREHLKYVIPSTVVILVLGYWFLGGSGVEAKTLVVKKGDFLQQVSVSGKVVAAKYVDLGFSQSGSIVGVYAAVGDRVWQGSPLAEVENGDLRATLLQKEAALDSEKAELTSLQVGTRPEEISVAEAEVSSDFSALLEEIRDAYSSSDNAIRNKVDQFIANPRISPQVNFKNTDSMAESSLEFERLKIESDLVSFQNLVLTLGAESDLFKASLEASSYLSRISTFLNSTSLLLTRAISTSDISQTTIDGYKTGVATSRSEVNTASASIASDKASLEVSRRNLVLKKAGSTAEDISAQAAKVKAAEAEVASARAQLLKTIVSAPFSGVVTKMDAKVGKIVSSNTPEISMMSDGVYQIESFVPEINVAFLKVGDGAFVTLDAYGEKVPFEALIISIDPAETIKDGVSTYRAILQFSTPDPRIRSGMTANVLITTEKKSDVLSVPQGAVMEGDGEKYVTLKSGDTTEKRPVTTGSVSYLGEVEILSGLSEGDEVVVPVKE